MIWKTHRAVAVATAAAIALTSVGLSPTVAAASPAKQAQVADNSGSTEFSSRHRRYGHRHGNAAALGAFAAIAGTIATIAIAEQRRREWRRHHQYYGPYGYPYGAPAPYGYYRY
jgi:hypothetical protein